MDGISEAMPFSVSTYLSRSGHLNTVFTKKSKENLSEI